MSYAIIQEKINNNKIIILDGGIGGELQKVGAKMDKGLWCGRCSLDNPNELLKVHENYINAGVDVITTNTYASTPISMKKYGYEDVILECNNKSVLFFFFPLSLVSLFFFQKNLFHVFRVLQKGVV